MSVVSFRDFSYAYPGVSAPALRALTLDLAPGEFVVLAGASGSGKSTLLRAVGGLVPHFHGGTAGGELEVAGLDLRHHGPADLAEHVGSLFQDPETQIVMGSVRAELAFPLENRGWGRAAIARAVEEAALALAIDGLLDRTTAELSGGELQRVALGATLAARPSVVCLDEPTSQLDPVAGDELIGMLRRLNEDQDLTVLLAEHRLERCLPAADRVLALVEGELAFDGAPAPFLQWALGAAPELVTPGARLLARTGLPPVAGVKAARAALRAARLLPDPAAEPPTAEGDHEDAERTVHRSLRQMRPGRRAGLAASALRFDHVWHELADGPAILRSLNLSVGPGERVALMGRNGAGKSTLLRHAAGLMKPTRGRVEASGRVALLLQNPADYLVHETVAAETTAAALERFGLGEQLRRHPRDLSGGEKQRLALAIVLGHGAEAPAVICLDEPTRGMDRAVKDDLVRYLATVDAAVIVATHDPEFAAALAERVVLLADGGVIADGPAAEILSGGTYFATETARILGGAGGALLADQGAALLSAERVGV